MNQPVRSFLIALICSFTGLAGFAQQANPVDLDGDHWCATDELNAKARTENPEIQRRHERWTGEVYNMLDRRNPNNQLSTVRAAEYRVPIVVHVIHNGPDGNLTDQEVFDGIDLLNKAFANITPYDQGIDTKMEFCLAQFDENGNPSNGIVRVDDPMSTNFDKSDDALLKALSRWDPTRYCNIYTVANITGGVAGYAYLPSSHGSSLDGIVCYAPVMGTSASTTSTLPHEMGHYLGLYHTWQGGCPNNDCLSDGDGICDTPPDNNTGTSCAGTDNSCSTDEDDPSVNNPFRPIAMGGLGDQMDMHTHFLDYGNHSCRSAFTQGSADRMIASLQTTRSSLITPANLSATGCQCDLQFPCTPRASFEASEIFICPGQTIDFTDLSFGPAASWSWTFQGGSPGTSTQQNPSVTYNNPGAYEVTLFILNNAGNATETRTAYINVVQASPPPVVEGFESLMPSDWAVSNPDGGGAWVVTDTVAKTGTYCLVFDNWNFPSNSTFDEITTGLIDLTNYADASFTFDYAYQRRSFDFTWDTLQVYVTADCGANWSMVWEKGGGNLATVTGNNFFSRFVPNSTQWGNESLDLSNFLGSDGVKIKFRNKGHNGQSLYIDNVNLSGAVSTGEQLEEFAGSLQVGPNPFANVITVNYTLPEKSAVRFSLHDLRGKQLHAVDAGVQIPGEHVQNLRGPIADLPAGIYLLRAGTDLGIVTRRVMKLN